MQNKHRLATMETDFDLHSRYSLKFHFLFSWTLFKVLSMRSVREMTPFSTPVLTGLECARIKLWETLRQSGQNPAIWASQRMLFDLTKPFGFFYIYFIAKVLCCFGIKTEEIHSTALKNFQVTKALVVAGEKIPLNVPNHRLVD